MLESPIPYSAWPRRVASAVFAVVLLTNNPKKVGELVQYCINVTGRLPHIIPPNPHNRFHLETKANRSGHWIDFSGKPRLAEQHDLVLVEGMPDTLVEDESM